MAYALLSAVGVIAGWLCLASRPLLRGGGAGSPACGGRREPRDSGSRGGQPLAPGGEQGQGGGTQASGVGRRGHPRG
jgi:hypothetical protein